MTTYIAFYDLTEAEMLPGDPAGKNGTFLRDATAKLMIGDRIAAAMIVKRPNDAGKVTDHLMVIYQS